MNLLRWFQKIKRVDYYLLTLTSLYSLESWKAGNCSTYLSIACWAFSMSTLKWQRAALKKYSLALYFNAELDKDDKAT